MEATNQFIERQQIKQKVSTDEAKQVRIENDKSTYSSRVDASSLHDYFTIWDPDMLSCCYCLPDPWTMSSRWTDAALSQEVCFMYTWQSAVVYFVTPFFVTHAAFQHQSDKSPRNTGKYFKYLNMKHPFESSVPWQIKRVMEIFFKRLRQLLYYRTAVQLYRPRRIYNVIMTLKGLITSGLCVAQHATDTVCCMWTVN